MEKTITSQKPIRLTISVTPEVHAAFERLSGASGMSMSRAMGEWLEDTLDAVEYTATMVEKARAAPKVVMREMHAYALGLADETGSLLDKVRAESGQAAAARQAQLTVGSSVPLSPPSCNTGGKVPRENPKPRARKQVVPDVPYSAVDPLGRRVTLGAGEYFDKSGQLRKANS